MGIGDKIGELKQKAEQLARQHPDKVDQAVDRIERYADEKTGGKHTEQIDKGADQLKRHFDEQGQPPQ
ncbi:MAG: antitoxin [Actinomycetota bacterium]|nr:antitoxin [Actinomycetota bacterium]